MVTGRYGALLNGGGLPATHRGRAASGHHREEHLSPHAVVGLAGIRDGLRVLIAKQCTYFVLPAIRYGRNEGAALQFGH